MSAGYSTIHTVLKWGATAAALTQKTKIKSYPQLGGEPNQLETTDLEDTQQTFVLGVQQISSMTFTLNYDLEVYNAIKTDAMTRLFYQLEFGENGANGKFQWQGQHEIYINEGSVDGVREMTLVVSPLTNVEVVS